MTRAFSGFVFGVVLGLATVLVAQGPQTTAMSFAGTVNPITVYGGDDTEGDTAIVFDSPTDHYIALRMLYGTDIVSDGRLALWSNYSAYPATARVELAQSNDINLLAGPKNSMAGGSLVLHASDGVTAGTVNVSGAQVGIEGHVLVNDLKTTGAALGKKVVCVDTVTGQLYASSTGLACVD